MTKPSSADELWRPAVPLSALQRRAELLAHIRAFFADRGVMEVDTPALSAAATTDPNLHSLSVEYHGPGGARRLYLHTSPEFPMKRLLAVGSGDIYQICKVFRDGESGTRHNPEFSLLEWYRVGFDTAQLMDEVAQLVTPLLAESLGSPSVEKVCYADAFAEYCGRNPHQADARQLAECARNLGLHAPSLADSELDAWRDFLWTHAVEPHLGHERLTFVYDYPASQAALARVRPGSPPVAERFELYVRGVELANGFHELADPAEQGARFAADLTRRATLNLPSVPTDQHLLAALQHGLPDCAGVALGIDRLLMLASAQANLAGVLAFPVERA